MRKEREYRVQSTEYRGRRFLFSVFFILFSVLCSLLSGVLADTIYLKDGSTEKGLVVEEYYDRFVFSTPDGEKEIFKLKIDEIFFDELYQNDIYLGKKFEEEGYFEKALQFYAFALKSNPDFKEAKDCIKGLEDAKWRFKKSWRYRELKETLKTQLGIVLKKKNGKVVIAKVSDTLHRGDVIISCWAKPLTYAGLKNASKILIGFSNTILKVVIERNIGLETDSSFGLFSPLKIEMEIDGPVVKSIKEGSPAYKAGLREGDLIVRINGDGTRYMKLSEVKKRIFTRSKSKMVAIQREITLMRKRAAPVTSNAMWAWHSKEVLLNEGHRKELLDFCRAKNIKILFFQLQYQFIPRGSGHLNVRYQTKELSPPVVCRLLYETKLREFLKEAHSQGIAVHALDGSAGFCLQEQHHLVLVQLKAILDFNGRVSAAERFDGIHYDNEPYLLPAYHSGRRDDVIRQFITLNQKCIDLIKSSGVKLEFGIDIPFWFDEVDSLDRKLIDICDNVGIMDYRNFASGPDGIIYHASNELKYAAEVGKKVFVGVETSKYPEQKVYFVSILNEDALIAESGRFERFSLRVHPDGKKRYLGLVRPQGAKDENFKVALSKLREVCGKISKPEDKTVLDSFIADTIYALSTNPEFRDIHPEEYIGDDGKSYLAFIADEVILEKLTFADMAEQDLNNTLSEAKKEFENYRSFAGFAIHHYKSYKELCEKK